jgi:hypothetical protein
MRVAPTRGLPSQALCYNGSISSQTRSAIAAASKDGISCVLSTAWRHEAVRAFSSQSRWLCHAGTRLSNSGARDSRLL